MCGITGIIDWSDNLIDERRLKAMTSTLAHRGPNHSNVWTDNIAGLGHARLSIIDLSSSANQPMFSLNKRYVIVFNGEIYNYLEIQEQLTKEGVIFRTQSDTEVVLSAYIKWGKKAINQFNGIFAFAIWDSKKKEAIIARDHFGVKPFYYYMLDSGLVFGSEIKAIHASGKYKARVNTQALSEFTYFGVSLGSNTLFDGIKKLLPGHYMIINQKEVNISQYWSINNITQIEKINKQEVVAKIRFLLEAAVKRQLISDVPVGIFLSGGIDSSAVTAFASKHYKGKLNTYSVGFDFDKGINELPRAKRVASFFGTSHNELNISGSNIENVIELLVWHHDEPFSDAANIPLFLLCKELNGNPRVVLQGDGGDEIFGGYNRYALMVNEKSLKVLSHFKKIVGLFPNESAKRLTRILYAFGQNESSLIMANLLTMDTFKKNLSFLFSSYWKDEIVNKDPFLRYRIIENQFHQLDSVQKMLYTDTTILLPDVFLEKVDKSTMAFSIESRVPFLDKELSEYVISLPSNLKVKYNDKKHLLKLALRGIVPNEVLDGPKTGFGVPYSYWLATSLYEYSNRIFSIETKRADSFFDKRHIFSLLCSHKRNPTQQTGFILWKALNLSIWHQYYFES